MEGKPGVNVEITTYESKVYWDELYNGNFDIAYDGWTGDYLDPDTNLNCFTQDRHLQSEPLGGRECLKVRQHDQGVPHPCGQQ